MAAICAVAGGVVTVFALKLEDLAALRYGLLPERERKWEETTDEPPTSFTWLLKNSFDTAAQYKAKRARYIGKNQQDAQKALQQGLVRV